MRFGGAQHLWGAQHLGEAMRDGGPARRVRAGGVGLALGLVTMLAAGCTSGSDDGAPAGETATTPAASSPLATPGTSSAPAITPTPTPTPTPTVTLTGTLRVSGRGGPADKSSPWQPTLRVDGTACRGAGQYADLVDGATVRVLGAGGSVLATPAIRDGHLVRREPSHGVGGADPDTVCAWTFSAPVPQGAATAVADPWTTEVTTVAPPAAAGRAPVVVEVDASAPVGH